MPHMGQKWASGSTAALQRGHSLFRSFDPHCLQNSAPSTFRVPHTEHFIGLSPLLFSGEPGRAAYSTRQGRFSHYTGFAPKYHPPRIGYSSHSHAYESRYPPSTTMFAPVMKSAAALARNRTTRATSSGSPILFRGTR